MSALIYESIPKIMSEVGAIEKNRRSAGTGISYSFRGIDDFYSALQPLLSKHAVFFSPKVTHVAREERLSASNKALLYTILTVEFTVYAKDGSSFTVTTIGEAMDSGDKSANKAMSAAMKYAFMLVFCIPTEEDKDTESQTHEITPQRKAPATPMPIVPVVPVEPDRPDGTAAAVPTDAQLRPALWANDPPWGGVASAGPTDAQLRRLFAIMHKSNWTEEQMRTRMFGRYKTGSTRELSAEQYRELCEHIGSNPHAH